MSRVNKLKEDHVGRISVEKEKRMLFMFILINQN
jgi:hypothetical protein